MQLGDDLVLEYLVECHEGLDRLDQDLVDLEHSDDDRAILDSIFRAFHTIKGGAGFFGFSRLERLTHAGEEVLSRLRDGELDLSTDIASGLLSLLDTVRATIRQIEEDRTEGSSDVSEVLALMRGFLQGETVEMASPLRTSLVDLHEANAAPERLGGSSLAVPAEMEALEPRSVGLEVPPAGDEALAPGYVEIFDVPSASSSGRAQGGTETAQAVSETRSSLHGQLSPAEGSAPHQSQALGEPGKPAVEGDRATRGVDEAPAGGGGLADSTIRVDVHLLDRLMNLVGELVLARNQILQHTSRSDDKALAATSQRLNLITTELQEGVMKTRMQPVGNIWSRFPRVVRDLALSLGKQVRLEMQGQETELDKTLIEALKDPLTHIVRNSVDHGVETPAERLAQGKPAEGKLALRAYHEGGQVNIEIADDGAGIDPTRVRRKAIERGLLSAEQAQRMADQELAQLVFWPGFSTASTITNISGRGVGMDVVKTNIEKIGGVIDLQNRPGHGLTIKIKIPLTLAIIPALLVQTGGERFAIPQANLLELVRVDLSTHVLGVERIDGMPVYRLRGRLLPLVFLNRALGLGGTEQPSSESLTVVVLQADGMRFGLVVDAVLDTEEIVVKPLGKQLKQIQVFAGATIMGDGRVALILDVPGLAQRDGLLAGGKRQAAVEREVDGDEEDKQRLLLCRAGGGRRLAIPLEDVARLEELERPRLERAGDRLAIQYRGEILPLIELARELREPDVAALDDKISLVVYADEQTSAGVVVDAILDIVEEPIRLRPARSGGVLRGSAILGGEVTDVLDLRTLVATSSGDVSC